MRRASASRVQEVLDQLVSRYFENYVISIKMTSWSDCPHEEFLSYYFSFIIAIIMNLRYNYNGTISDACRLPCFTQAGESFDNR